MSVMHANFSCRVNMVTIFDNVFCRGINGWRYDFSSYFQCTPGCVAPQREPFLSGQAEPKYSFYNSACRRLTL